MLRAAYAGYPVLHVPSGGPRRELVLHMPQSRFERYAAYRGHVPPSFAERVPNPFVFTFLREPIDRLISEYYYNRSIACTAPPSLRAYLEDGLSDNPLTRALAGEPVADAAIEVLSKMDFVGLMERFDRDIARLFERLGRPNVAPSKWGSTYARVEFEDLSSDVRAALRERTTADRKVYEWALERSDL